jgi:5-(carboxyamino)imidazole ribonucleotide synthase
VDRPSPILPPAAIGILGGGQLGRMLALAARAMGYRIRVLDPDPQCPAAAVADSVVVASYDDVDAAIELAEGSSVVTYELEHVASAVVEAIEARRPVRPGLQPLLVTQDRLAERRFVEAAGVPVAPWRAVRSPGDVLLAAAELDLPIRLKVPVGGYDGRSQLRITAPADLDDAWTRLGRHADTVLLAERELAFEAELSVVLARDIDGRVGSFPVGRNVHDQGILVETVAPAPVAPGVAERAVAIGTRLAEAMDLVGTLTVELFLLADGQLVVNELAPRVHNSGHWTIEGAATSQFEQHVRAICGLGLGESRGLAPAAMVNVLGTGPRRPARLLGVDAALEDPAVHLHLYGKREVFERRKMGHVTAIGATVDDALARAYSAVGMLTWEGMVQPGAPVDPPRAVVPG